MMACGSCLRSEGRPHLATAPLSDRPQPVSTPMALGAGRGHRAVEAVSLRALSLSTARGSAHAALSPIRRRNSGGSIPISRNVPFTDASPRSLRHAASTRRCVSSPQTPLDFVVRNGRFIVVALDVGGIERLLRHLSGLRLRPRTPRAPVNRPRGLPPQSTGTERRISRSTSEACRPALA